MSTRHELTPAPQQPPPEGERAGDRSMRRGGSPSHTSTHLPHLEPLLFLLLSFFSGGGGAHKAPTRGRCMRNVHRRKGRWITRPSVRIDG